MPARRYLVKEIFGPTLQGEGAHAGTPVVFLRFAGCNLTCTWCDTDFAPEGASRLEAGEIVDQLLALDTAACRRVVVTGGEPTMQWDAPLADAVRNAGFRAHMESNGTRALAAPVDWLTVSPKPRFHEANDTIVLTRGDECKVVLDATVDETQLARYEAMDFTHHFLQPCWGDGYEASLARAVATALARPRWRVSMQTHKLIGIP